MSKLAFRAQTVDIAYLPLRQDLFSKNVLMTAQRDFRLGNSLLSDPISFLQFESIENILILLCNIVAFRKTLVHIKQIGLIDPP